MIFSFGEDEGWEVSTSGKNCQPPRECGLVQAFLAGKTDVRLDAKLGRRLGPNF